jgi:hypothetical protein
LADRGVKDPEEFQVMSHLCREVALIIEARRLNLENGNVGRAKPAGRRLNRQQPFSRFLGLEAAAGYIRAWRRHHHRGQFEQRRRAGHHLVSDGKGSRRDRFHGEVALAKFRTDDRLRFLPITTRSLDGRFTVEPPCPESQVGETADMKAAYW